MTENAVAECAVCCAEIGPEEERGEVYIPSQPGGSSFLIHAACMTREMEIA